MARFKYLYLTIPLLCFIFVKPTYAAVSQSTISGTDNMGRTMNVRYQSYTQELPVYMNVEQNGNLTEYISKWNITENINVILEPNYYYTGWITVSMNISTSQNLTRVTQSLDNTNATEGLHVYLTAINTNTVNLTIVFDNFSTQAHNVIGMPTVHFEYVNTNTSLLVESSSFTPTVTITSNLTSYEGVQNNALTAMLYSAIEQSTDLDFQTIIGLLNTIKNQDYTYYNQIVNALGLQGQIHLDLSNIYAVLVGTQNNIQDGFTDVQTILDLFPSYRTQVLQYWQQLLEMNAAQSSTADAIQENYSQAESNADHMANQLGSVNLPSVDSGNLNILGSVDTTQKSNFFGMLSIITHTELVTKIMLIIVIGAMVGFILYGKKGG